MFWEYDGKLGRRWNVDPVFKEYESPYACFGNNPIWMIDPLGNDSSLYSKNDGKLLAKGKTSQEDKTAIWEVDDQSQNYDPKNPWKTATPLKYGKTAKYGTELRKTHPLFGKGFKEGDQVFEEDLLDMTKEFEDMVKANIGVFIKKNVENEKMREQLTDPFICAGSTPDAMPAKVQFVEMNILSGFVDLVNTDRPYDLKSRTRNNLTKIPSYHAYCIGQYSFYRGHLLHYDDYGNLSFFIFGTAYGFSLNQLVGGSNTAQIISNTVNLRSLDGDPKRDVLIIKLNYHYDFWYK